jgi:drug/metabolite transporter (DMT)-like permease
MNNKLLSWLLFILLCFIWGSSFILMKEGKTALTAAQIASLRIFSAGIIFLPFAFYHIRFIPRKKMGLMVVTGLFGNLFPAFLFAAAIIKLDSSLEGILNSLTPICMVIIGIVFFKDKIEWQKILGVIVGFAGLCLLAMSRKDINLDNLGYAGLVVLATIFYGLNVNIVGHFLKDIKPVHMASVSLAFMCLPAGIVLWSQDFFSLDFSVRDVQLSVLNVVVLGIVGSAFATVLFYALVQKAGPLFASLVTYGIPFVALFWGSLVGETITFKDIACLLLILLGVFLAKLQLKKKVDGR